MIPIVLVALELIQAFTNCVHGYECASNVHVNGITHALKLVNGVYWENSRELLIVCPHGPLCFKEIRTATTTEFLISNTVVLNP